MKHFFGTAVFAAVALLLLLPPQQKQCVEATPAAPINEHIDSWRQYALVLHHEWPPMQEDLNNGSYTVISDHDHSGGDNNNNGVVVAEARFAPSALQKGWNFLEIDTTRYFGGGGGAGVSSSSSSSKKATVDLFREYYAGGRLEGFISYDSILDSGFLGTWDEFMQLGAGAAGWVKDHLDYMQRQVASHADTNPRWRRVGAILKQLEGLADGFNARGRMYQQHNNNEQKPANMTFHDMFAANFGAEIGDVLTRYPPMMKTKDATILDAPLFIKNTRLRAKLSRRSGLLNDENEQQNDDSSWKEQHCSALVRVTDSDVYVAHATWGSFGIMLRTFKIYNWSDASVTMSSYPGAVMSEDDWYTLPSSNLSVTETSLSIYNNSLYYAHFPYQVVSEFIRAMVANYLATSGETWCDIFTYSSSSKSDEWSSGTYNNEWIIVDNKQLAAAAAVGDDNDGKKHVAPGETTHSAPSSPPVVIKDNLLWVLDQLPGYVVSGDLTDVLRKDKFFGSWNMPYWKKIYDLAGFAQKAAEYGTYYSYDKYARAEIFARDAPKVAALEQMQAIMRQNNFKTDPLARIPNCSGTPGDKCDPPYSAWLAIAARGDLAPVGGAKKLGPLHHGVEQSMNGALDAKIALASTVHKFESVIISGPPCYSADSPSQASIVTANSSTKVQHLPCFNWSASPGGRSGPHGNNPLPPGMPNYFDFRWYRVTASASSGAGDDDGSDQTGYIVGGIFAGFAAIGIVALLAMKLKGGDDDANAAATEGRYQSVGGVQQQGRVASAPEV